MYSKQYQVYLDNVFKLVRSFVIKSEITAQRINDDMLIRFGEGHFDPNDKTTWKYYLNISGEYHHTDEIIQVNSFDTHALIPFTKGMLNIHANTKNEYRVGTNYHKELVHLHPDKEDLIRGILNPVDINKAIDSDDFTLLAYSSEFVDENEYTLMMAVQDFIKMHSARFYNNQFNISEDMYTATYFAVLSMMLIPAIINHRKKMCKTSEAHSFHISQYLHSHSNVGEQMQYLTHEQRMFFMRNIRHIERSAGNKENFDWIKEALMDSISLPVNSFELRHDLTGMPDTLKPEVIYKKITIGSTQGSSENLSYKLKDMLDKTDSLAQLNVPIRLVEEESYERSAKYAIRNNSKIKIIESTATTLQHVEEYSLDDVLINHWSYLAGVKTLNGSASYRMPNSSTVLTLDAMDAFLMFIYSFALSNGVRLTRIPDLKAFNVRPMRPVTYETLRSITTDYVVSDAVIGRAMADLPPVPASISMGVSFRNYVTQLHKALNTQHRRASTRENIHERAQFMNMHARLWSDYRHPRYTLNTYEEFFKKHQINITDYTDLDITSIWGTIYQLVTGVSSDAGLSMAGIQTAMLRLMSQLSSYSVRFIGNMEGTISQKVRSPISRINSKNTEESAKISFDSMFEIPRIYMRNIRISTESTKKLDLYSGSPMTFVLYDHSQGKDKAKILVKTEILHATATDRNPDGSIEMTVNGIPKGTDVKTGNIETVGKHAIVFEAPSIDYGFVNAENALDTVTHHMPKHTVKVQAETVMKVKASFISKVSIRAKIT